MANDLNQVSEPTKLRAVCNFYRADADYGLRLADALQVDIAPYPQHIGAQA